MAKASQPSGNKSFRWSTEAKARRKELIKSLEVDTNSIAEALAHQLGHSQVDAPHVEDAFRALQLNGLSRRRQFNRPEAELALGTLLFGLAFACPEPISKLTAIQYAGAVANGLFVGLLVVGLGVAVHGWYRGHLPKPPKPKLTRRQLFGRALLIAGAILTLCLCAYLAWHRIAGLPCENCGDDAQEAIPASEGSILFSP